MDDSGELPPSVSRSGRPVKRSNERIIAPTPNKKKKSLPYVVIKHVNDVWLEENTSLLDFEKDFELPLAERK